MNYFSSHAVPAEVLHEAVEHGDVGWAGLDLGKGVRAVGAEGAHLMLPSGRKSWAAQRQQLE